MKQHSSQFINLVATSKKRIREISSQVLKSKIDNQEALFLVDVREDNEWVSGHIPTAIHIGKGVIERDIEKTIPDFQSQIIVYCSGGFRSALAADSIQNMGYKNVNSLEHGSQGWIDSGYQLVL